MDSYRKFSEIEIKNKAPPNAEYTAIQTGHAEQGFHGSSYSIFNLTKNHIGFKVYYSLVWMINPSPMPHEMHLVTAFRLYSNTK